jgi:hypothetical protein
MKVLNFILRFFVFILIDKIQNCFATVSPSPPSTSTLSSYSPSTTNSTAPSSTLPRTTSTSPYIPCQSWIYFGMDDSVSLDSVSFQKQLNFASDAIGALNHPERIAVGGTYYNTSKGWNSSLTIQQLQSNVTNMQQYGDYQLQNHFMYLSYQVASLGSTSSPIAAVVFISNTSDTALVNASNYYNQLPDTVDITFILLGPNPDPTKLTDFSSYFIEWRDLSQPQPDNWNSLSYDAYGCDDVMSPTSFSPTYPAFTTQTSMITQSSSSIASSNPTTPPSTAITPPLPALNCSDPNNSYIINQTCAINDTIDPSKISQIINTTSSKIQNSINNGTLTSENVHDAGIFIYNTVTTVKNLHPNVSGIFYFLELQ